MAAFWRYADGWLSWRSKPKEGGFKGNFIEPSVIKAFADIAPCREDKPFGVQTGQVRSDPLLCSFDLPNEGPTQTVSLFQHSGNTGFLLARLDRSALSGLLTLRRAGRFRSV
jgi:hypothetical protein